MAPAHGAALLTKSLIRDPNPFPNPCHPCPKPSRHRREHVRRHTIQRWFAVCEPHHFFNSDCSNLATHLNTAGRNVWSKNHVRRSAEFVIDGNGSKGSVTSSAAVIRPCRNSSNNASISINPPRATLIRHALFISNDKRRLSNIPRVSGVKAAHRTTTEHELTNSSSSTSVAPCDAIDSRLAYGSLTNIDPERRQQSRKCTTDSTKSNYPNSTAKERLAFANLCVCPDYSVAHLRCVVRNSPHKCQRQSKRHLSYASSHRIRSICNRHEFENLLRHTRLTSPPQCAISFTRGF